MHYQTRLSTSRPRAETAIQRPQPNSANSLHAAALRPRRRNRGCTNDPALTNISPNSPVLRRRPADAVSDENGAGHERCLVRARYVPQRTRTRSPPQPIIGKFGLAPANAVERADLLDHTGAPQIFYLCAA